MYIYPENLKAKPMLWLWLLRDIAIIGVAALISVLSLVQGVGMAPAGAGMSASAVRRRSPGCHAAGGLLPDIG